jgi:hypothetical protein
MKYKYDIYELKFAYAHYRTLLLLAGMVRFGNG